MKKWYPLERGNFDETYSFFIGKSTLHLVDFSLICIFRMIDILLLYLSISTMGLLIRVFLPILFLTLSITGYASNAPKPISLSTIETRSDSLNSEISSGTLSLSARSRGYTPVFYLDDFPRYFWGGTGGELIVDDWDQIDPTETVVFPKSLFTVEKIIRRADTTLLQVRTSEYPYDSDPHYIDARHVQIYESGSISKERNIELPSRAKILRNLKSQVGKPYVWWGNAPNGISSLASFYPPSHPLDAPMRSKWTLDGFDCSGILYWATHGYTPRNTSKLITFGTGVKIAGKTPVEIAGVLKPLDIIVWKGHNMIVIDTDHILESTANFTGTGNYSTPNGVRIRPIVEALEEVMNTKWRIAVDEYADNVPEGKKKFVIRRWFEK